MADNPSTLLHKKRKHLQNNNDDLTFATKLHEFKHSPSSLRISASQVSALVGLHPYQNLPQLLFDLVYQSYLGQHLLQIDAKALGLSLIDAKVHEEEQMLTLATAASKETKQLIQQVLEVSSGKRKLESINEVQSIQKKIASSASDAQKAGRMSQKQVDALVEASRGHVSTGFGTCHEDEALDVYEKRVGCIVRERNEGLMEWEFERVELEGSETGVSAAPLGKARRRLGWVAFRQQQQQSDGENARDKECGGADEMIPVDVSSKDVETEVDFFEEKKSQPDDIEKVDSHSNPSPRELTKIQRVESKMFEATNDTSVQSSSAIEDKDSTNFIDLTSDEQSEKLEDLSKRPFFKIVGAVDGIRDEVYMKTRDVTNKRGRGEFSDDEMDQMMANYKTPTKKNDGQLELKCTIDTNDDFADDDCDITLRPIIVECKHRMKKATIPPPLYDQIQTCMYCQMHETEEADLIQVVRKQSKRPELKADEKQFDTDDNQHIEITISRISLNDPIHNHKYHWTATLLPRLASFVDAVYSIRKDDTKRYRMIMALVNYQDENADAAAETEAWSILWNECPWLKHCDTSYGRRR
jgi:hypothetical protein